MDELLRLMGVISGYSLVGSSGYRVIFLNSSVVDIYLSDGIELSIHDTGDRLVFFRTDVSVGVVVEKFDISHEDSLVFRSWMERSRAKSKGVRRKG